MNNVTSEPQNVKVCEESKAEPRIAVEESQVALLKERIRELERDVDYLHKKIQNMRDIYELVPHGFTIQEWEDYKSKRDNNEK